MQPKKQQEELDTQLQFCVQPGCQNNLIPLPLTFNQLKELHKGHVENVLEFKQTHKEFSDMQKTETLHSIDQLPELIQQRVASTLKSGNLRFEQYNKIISKAFFDAIAKGDLATFQQQICRDQYHTVPFFGEYSNAVKQMKEVIKQAYDTINEFIEKTLAKASQAIEKLTKQCIKTTTLETNKQGGHDKLTQEQSIKVVVQQDIDEFDQEQKSEEQESNIGWMWSTTYKGENCHIEGSLLKGVKKYFSNCFIEPSFGVFDTKTIKLRLCLDTPRDKSKNTIRQMYDTSFQILDTAIRMKTNPELDSPVEPKQGTYCFKRKEYINKDTENSEAIYDSDDFFKFDGEWHQLELTYDPKQKTIEIYNTETEFTCSKAVKFEPSAKLQFAVGIYSQNARFEIL